MKEILLQKSNLKTFVDDDVYEKFKDYKFYPCAGAHTTYALRYQNQTTFQFHREIMELKKHDGLVVDHINGNGLDNRRENLRVCTMQQNCWNKKNTWKKNVTSQYRGVSLHGAKWMASIGFNMKSHNLGCYKTEVEAAIAYDKAAKKYFGKFAVTNFSLTADERAAQIAKEAEEAFNQ